MDLSSLASRLPELCSQGISYYERGKLTRKLYPEAFTDVRKVQSRLQAVGIKSGMRVGILAENCYEWVLWELALLDRSCVSVCFPVEEFSHVPLDHLADQYGLHLLGISEKERERRQEPREWVTLLNGKQDDGVRIRSSVSDTPGENGRAFSLDPDVFSLVFSSGTSGKLKCLLMGKRGTEDLIATYGRNYTFRKDDSILVFLPLSSFQQRLMVYTAIWYGFDLLLTTPPQLFRALKELQPTILAGPPLLYETLENRFHALSAWRRLLARTAGCLLNAVPVSLLRSQLQRKCFAPFHAAFGGRVRLMLTGSAPSRRSTLELFNLLGLPLYQVYGLAEVGFVSWNLPGANRLGSVGKVLADGKVTIAEDGEILVRYSHPRSHGYLDCDVEEERRTYLGNNQVATGDIGYFDRDGYLYITGRKKQIIITQGGYKVQPEVLEQEIERCPHVSRAVIFGGGEISGLVALVSLRGENDPLTQRKVCSHVDNVNLALPSASRIGRVVVTSVEFRADNGFLTRNLKVNRQALYEAFRGSLLGLEANSTTCADTELQQAGIV
jgi:long-chain acyl-CoA synthetase